MPVNEADLGLRLEHGGGAREGARGQDVVGGEKHGVVAVRPVDETLVEGGDVAPVLGVHVDLDAVVFRREAARHLGAVVRRGVVDHEHPYVHVRLLEHAPDAVRQVVPVAVAGDHHADAGPPAVHELSTAVAPSSTRARTMRSTVAPASSQESPATLAAADSAAVLRSAGPRETRPASASASSKGVPGA